MYARQVKAKKLSVGFRVVCHRLQNKLKRCKTDEMGQHLQSQ